MLGILFLLPSPPSFGSSRGCQVRVLPSQWLREGTPSCRRLEDHKARTRTGGAMSTSVLMHKAGITRVKRLTFYGVTKHQYVNDDGRGYDVRGDGGGDGADGEWW